MAKVVNTFVKGKLNKDLDALNNFVIGPIKNRDVIVKNINSEFSIIHVVTEKNI